MGMDDRYHQRILDQNLALIDTPLIATMTSHYPNQHHSIPIYPFNVSNFRGNTPPSSSSTSLDIIDTGNGNGYSNSYQSMLYVKFN